MKQRMLGWLAAGTLAAATQPRPPAVEGDRNRQELIEHLFGMDERSFEAELERRFQYAPPPAPPTVADAAQGRALDAAYLRSFPEFDRSYSPAAKAEAERLAAELAREAENLSHESFVLRVAEIVALANNAHTAIDQNSLRKNTPRIPLRTFLFEDGLYVLRAPRTHGDLLGARVEAIEGRSIDEIYRLLARYLPGPDRRRRLQLLPVLESPALLHAAGIAGDRSTLALTLRTVQEQLVERRIAAEDRGPAAPVMNSIRLLFPALEGGTVAGLPFTDSEVPVWLRNRTRLFSSDRLPLGGYYLRLTHNSDGDEEPIESFLSAALAQVRSRRPNFVMLDMRMNGGGDYTKTYDFAHTLPRAAAGTPIYVLTSPWTFSAAITTIAALEDAAPEQVHIVGEPVGDRMSFWAEGGTFRLPNSQVAVYYAAGRHDYRKACEDRSQCFWLNELYPIEIDDLEVDLAAPLTFAAWRSGRDPAVEAVLALERSRNERD